MIRFSACAALAVLAAAPWASAADKAEKHNHLKGAWTHTVGDMTVTFTFGREEMTVEFSRSDAESVHIEAAYGVAGDGLVFGVVTKVDRKGSDAGPEKGDLFRFEAKADKDELTISDLNTGKGVSEEAKQLLQGPYKKK